MAARLVVVAIAAQAVELDEMWLRRSLVADAALRARYAAQMGSVQVVGDAATVGDAASLAQLRTAAEELGAGLTAMLGAPVRAACCGGGAAAAALTVRVGAASAGRGPEGYGVAATPASVTIDAATASGALYGAYAVLGAVRRGEAAAAVGASEPKTDLRLWDLWDTLTGDITRGFAGFSVVWPMATYKNPDVDDAPKTLLFVGPCDERKNSQGWTGVFDGSRAAPLVNAALKTCVAVKNGLRAVDCASSDAAEFWYNETSSNLALAPENTPCLDVNHAQGPNLDTYRCHPLGERDYQNQQWKVRGRADGATALESVSAEGQCLELRDGVPRSPAQPANVTFAERLGAMARLLKSAGVNGVVLNDVNACGVNVELFQSAVLENVGRNVGPVLARHGITPYFSACFAAPTLLDNVTADPRSAEAAAWWEDKVAEVYEALPGFGGFLVKADSEGNVGPLAFNASEADGANLLAKPLAKRDGVLIWRAFVYGNADFGGEELVKQSYDTFAPLDGKFDANVILQIKNGPMDFQIREPAHPLFGALNETDVMMEVQAAQEYTGQQIHAVNLVTMWSEYLAHDTGRLPKKATLADLIVEGRFNRAGPRPRRRTGMAAVSNLGSWANWTGHVLAGSNVYGFGALAWDPFRDAEAINAEWAAMTFPAHADDAPGANEDVQTVVADILAKSRRVYEGYTSPLGIAMIVFGGDGGGENARTGSCAPITAGPGPGPDGAECPVSPGRRLAEEALGDLRGGLDHYWVDPCSNYGFSNYSTFGLGCDRTTTGTGYADAYAPAVRDLYTDPATCPQDLLLWFHNLAWTHPMPKPPGYPVTPGASVTLFEHIRFTHDAAVRDAAALASSWDTLEGKIDDARFYGVQARFAQQVNDAGVMRDTILDQYADWAGF